MRTCQNKEKMKVEFELGKKKINVEGKDIEYYVLKRELINGDKIEVSLKGDKAKLLLMSLHIESLNEEKK